MKVERRRRQLGVECSVCCLLEKVSNICWNVEIWIVKSIISTTNIMLWQYRRCWIQETFSCRICSTLCEKGGKEKWRQNKSKERVEDKKYISSCYTANCQCRSSREKNETKLSACPRRMRKDVCRRETTLTIHREIIKLCCMHSSENGPFPSARHRWVNERIELCESDKLWQPRARHG